MKKWQILLADDHPIILSGLVALLSMEGDLEVVGMAKDGQQAVQLAKTVRPDLVIMDLNMPKLDGLSALIAMREQIPDLKVLVLTSVDDEKYLFRVLQAGGCGYVLKQAADDELLNAVREVLEGKAFVRPPVAQMLATEALNGTLAPVDETAEKLTPREREVLTLLARGLTNQQIADELVISIRTAETHRANILDKLGLRDRASLVQYAIRKGYLS